MIDKQRLLEKLCNAVRTDLEVLLQSQQETQRGAVHAENRSEHAKDTRATEQSYLARGLAERVEALHDALERLASLELARFGPDEAVAVTALVEVLESDESQSKLWWIVPVSGGVDLPTESGTVRTITPTSPLGRALLGGRVGDEIDVKTPRGLRSLEILEIC